MRALALVGILLLSACGQAGELYLPDQTPPAAGAPAAPADEDEDRK
jgi:predicted small lipoprotein YifL